MSSYLNIYLVPKRKDRDKEEKQHLLFASYSRSTDIYEVFNEYVNPIFIGNAEGNYTSLIKDDVDLMIDGILTDIRNSQERLDVYEQYASKNEEYIQEILDLREIIRDYKSTHDFLLFLKGLVEDTIDGYNDFEEVCCNID